MTPADCYTRQKFWQGPTDCEHMSGAVDLCLQPPLVRVLGLLLCMLCGRAAVRLLIFFNWIVLFCPACSDWWAIPADTEAPIQEHSRRPKSKSCTRGTESRLVCSADVSCAAAKLVIQKVGCSQKQLSLQVVACGHAFSPVP